MPLYPMQFPILSPQQANPLLYGLQQGTQIAGQNIANQLTALRAQAAGIQNQYLAPTLQQGLLAKQLANALSGVNLQYAPQQQQSKIALTQAQANAQNALPGLYGSEAGLNTAQAGLANQRASLLGQQMPYLVQQEQEKIFPDPVLNRLYQINLAQKTGAIPSNLLSAVGFGGQPSASQPSSGNTGTSLPSYLLSQRSPGITPASAPPAFSGNAATNFLLFGTPYNPIQFAAAKKGAETQGATGITQYNAAQKDAAQSADLGNQVSNLLEQFKNNYGKTDLTGSLMGHMPAMTSAAQATDNASQNIAATVAKLIAGGRVTNYEMAYINHLKPNRVMNPATAQMTANFLQQKALRMEEEQSFLNTARTKGIDVQTAQNLWQQYNNQRPVYNFALNQPNTQFQKSWGDYLTPQAINAAKSGQQYVPIPTFSGNPQAAKQQFQAWAKTLSPSDLNTLKAELAQTGGQ